MDLNEKVVVVVSKVLVVIMIMKVIIVMIVIIIMIMIIVIIIIIAHTDAKERLNTVITKTLRLIHEVKSNAFRY